MSTLQSLRRTGRTTRMLEAAFNYALTQPVLTSTLVLVSSRNEVTDVACQLEDLATVAGRLPAIGVVNARWGDPDYDWYARPIRHRRSACRVFVDPHVIELQYDDILDLYHAWDAPITVAGGPPPLEPATPPLSIQRPPRKLLL